MRPVQPRLRKVDLWQTAWFWGIQKIQGKSGI
jgi:hypothetical protein